jgi:prefoldin subunit 5
MDEDIREHLKELDNHLQAVARQIGSTKSTIQSLTAMSDCLKDAKTTLDTYIRIQKDRYMD